MIAGGLLLLAGLMMFCTGLLGEMLMRTYFESQDRRIYAVREILTRKQRGVAGETRVKASSWLNGFPTTLATTAPPFWPPVACGTFR